MRRIAALIIMLSMGLWTLHAQKSSLFIGAAGGANLSKFKYTGGLSELYPVSNRLAGLNAGATFGIQIKNLTLSSGLQYVQKGSEYQTDNFEDELGVGFFSARERLHFLSVPLLLGYRKDLGEKFGLSIAIGPSFNFGLGGKLDEEVEYFGSTEPETTNYLVHFGSGVNEDYRTMQVGFQFSPGLYYKLNDRSRITLNVTWDSGIGDSFNPRYKNANSFFDDFQGSQLNRSTIFTVGYERHFSIGDRY